FLLVLLLSTSPSLLPTTVSLLGVTSLTAVLLVVDLKSAVAAKKLLQNNIMVGLGKVSFSLYMWHQPYLAFGRYFAFETLGFPELLVLALLIGATSLLSYRYIEKPFRDPK